MFAGDKSKPPADASYKNLLWESFHVNHNFNIRTKILRDKEIGTIESWGPFFRVSFDLIIHSLLEDEWSSVLAFVDGMETIPIPIPAINFHRSGFLNFQNKNFQLTFDFNIKRNIWYNVIIEQKTSNGKVIEMLITS